MQDSSAIETFSSEEHLHLDSALAEMQTDADAAVPEVNATSAAPEVYATPMAEAEREASSEPAGREAHEDVRGASLSGNVRWHQKVCRRLQRGPTAAARAKSSQRFAWRRSLQCFRHLQRVPEEPALLEREDKSYEALPCLLGSQLLEIITSKLENEDEGTASTSEHDKAAKPAERDNLSLYSQSGDDLLADSPVYEQPEDELWRPEEEPAASFFTRAEQILPSEQRGKPAMSLLLEDVELQHIRQALQEEGPTSLLRRYVGEHLRGCSVSGTGWQQWEGGSQVCQLRFRMPLPADAPEALKRLASIPAESATTVMVRLQADDSQVLLNFDTQTHDAPFGNNFWVADQLLFEAEAGGVRLRKFSGLRWTQSLPWYAGIVGAVADSKAAAGALPAGEAFARIAQAV